MIAPVVSMRALSSASCTAWCVKPVGCTYCAGLGFGFAVASSVLMKSIVTGCGLLAVRCRRMVAPAGTVVPSSVLASS